jgi:hypothetical protein
MGRNLTEQEVDAIGAWLKAKCHLTGSCPRCRHFEITELECSVAEFAGREILMIECGNCYYLQFFVLSKVLEKAAALN